MPKATPAAASASKRPRRARGKGDNGTPAASATGGSTAATGGASVDVASIVFNLVKLGIGAAVLFVAHRELIRRTNCRLFDPNANWTSQPIFLALFGNKKLCAGCRGELADTELDGDSTIIGRMTPFMLDGDRYCFNENGQVVDSTGAALGRLRKRQTASIEELRAAMADAANPELAQQLANEALLDEKEQ